MSIQIILGHKTINIRKLAQDVYTKAKSPLFFHWIDRYICIIASKAYFMPSTKSTVMYKDLYHDNIQTWDHVEMDYVEILGNWLDILLVGFSQTSAQIEKKKKNLNLLITSVVNEELKKKT